MLLLTVCGGVWADEETFDFVGWNFDGASSWTTAYTMRTVTGTAATVVFANANKQPTGNLITDCPVTKGSEITVNLNDQANTITGVEIVLKQWGSRAQTVTLNTSTDGTTFEPSTNKASDFFLSATDLNAKAVKFTFSSSTYQVGIQSIKIIYSAADTRMPATLTFATPDGFTFQQGEGTHTVNNVATLSPEIAGATIAYSSDNESVATVDGNGQVTVNDVAGTATITATFAGDDAYRPAKASYTIKVLKTYANIAELASAGTATDEFLKLTNAQVTYVNGRNMYLQDASGAILLYDTSAPYTQGQILNGLAKISTKLYNSLPEITAFTAQDGLTVTDGTVVPAEMSIADAVKTENLSKYIKMTDAVVSGGKLSDGTNTLALYDTYKQGFSFATDGTYDIVAVTNIFNNTQQLAVISMAVKKSVDKELYVTAYYSGMALQVPEGMKAMTYTVSGNSLTVSQEYAAGTVIPAGEAVVLEANAASDFILNVVPGNTATPDANNQLKGTDSEMALPADAANYFYMLSLDAASTPGSIGFYWGNADGSAFTNGAHKAYLSVPKTAAAKSFYLFNEATSIQQVQTATEADANAPVYNLAGQRVSKRYRGLVVQNGKKFVNR